MDTKRIIPCLDVYQGRVVKGVQFVEFMDAGDPAEIAAYYSANQADELVFLDINATMENREIMLDVVKRTAERISVPLTVGGGIRTLNDIERILGAGASKISINTAAIRYPSLINEASQKFGSQKIVIAIDAKKVPNAGGSGYRVFINGGMTDGGKDAVEWAKEACERGAGELLVTSIDFDGTKDGYDLPLTKAITHAVNQPVIASGGAGKLSDFYDVLTAGGADGALAASLFHFKEMTVEQVKEYLKEKGVAIRQ